MNHPLPINRHGMHLPHPASRLFVMFTLLGILSLPALLRAQDPGVDAATRTPDGGLDLALTGVHGGGLVRLRWGTGSIVVWNLIRRNGVLLMRQAASQADTTVLNGGAPQRVWSEEQWRARRDMPGAAQALQLLEDDSKERAGLTPYAEADLDRNRLTGLLLMAEFNFELATALALGHADASAPKDAVIRYEIRVVDDVRGDTLRAECFIDTGEETPVMPVTGLRAEAADGRIDLWWDRTPAHSGYHVERRAQGSAEWTRLTAQPRLFADNYPDQHLFRDSVANNRTWEYRVLGVDAFGREGASLATVSVRASDQTAPEPPFDLKWEKKDNRVLITWKLPPPELDLAGYGLLRSTRPDDGYTPVHAELLARGTTSYSDAVPTAGTWFYRLFAADTAGNISGMSVRAMAVIDDTLAPDPPVGLLAIADTTGVITLRWNMRHGDDVAGFRVYRIIDGGAVPEYVPLTPGVIVDTVWRDTLMADVRDRFLYRVRTVDFAGNYSTPSAPVTVRFPDRTPPVRPVIERTSMEARRVSLRFASPSGDVAGYTVTRRRLEEQASARAGDRRERRADDLVVRAATGSWVDTSARHGMLYRYVVTAVDSAGNVSAESDPAHVQPFWSVTMPVPDAPACRHDAARGMVRIAWTLPLGDGWSAIVFRRIGEGPFLQLSPQLTAATYDDATVRSGGYEYAVKYYYTGQGGSELGAATRVVIP